MSGPAPIAHHSDVDPWLDVRESGIPDALKAYPFWLVWRAEERTKCTTSGAYLTKVPYDARTGRRTNAITKSGCVPFNEALAAYRRSEGFYAGIGVPLFEDNLLIGIDEDHCVGADGRIDPEALVRVRLLGSYTEHNPSGTGLRTFLFARKPGPRCRKGAVEIYDRDRFLTVTGHHLEGTPLAVEHRQAELEVLYRLVFGLEENSVHPRRKPAPVPRLAQLLRAKRTGTLEALKRTLHDPTIDEAVAAFIEAAPPKKALRVGLDHLVRLSPTGARLSYLDGRIITQMCHRAEREGRKRNSVRRYLLRAISLLLRHHAGRAERDRIFADVNFPAVDDTREIHLTPLEIRRLLQACHTTGYPALATVIRMALLTSADRGVLLSGEHEGKTHRGLLMRDLRIWQDNAMGSFTGEVFLQDSKTEHRSRSVPITDNLCRELLPLVKMKDPDEPVFDLNYGQLDYVWKRARKAAGLSHIRFKDLRAQISIYGEEAGVPLTAVARSMGHRDEKMTRRYQQRAATLSAGQAEAIEQAMFARQGGETRMAG